MCVYIYTRVYIRYLSLRGFKSVSRKGKASKASEGSKASKGKQRQVKAT